VTAWTTCRAPTTRDVPEDGIISLWGSNGIRVVATPTLPRPAGNPALTFIKDWVPLLLLVAAYELMRDLAAMTGIPAHDLSGLDAFIPGGAGATRGLQAALYHRSALGPLDVVATAVYFMHFVLPGGVGLVLWRRGRSRYRRFAAALLAVCALAFLTYVLLPTTPPWLGKPDQVYKVIDATIRKLHLPGWLVGVYVHHDYNLYAAFPSLHAAFPLIAAVYGWRLHPGLGTVLLAWTVAVWFSVVYLGEHYLVDVAAGVVYASASVAAVELLWRREAPAVVRASDAGGARSAGRLRCR